MNPIRTIRRLACLLTGFAAALAAAILGAPAAFAEQWPHPLPGVTVRQAPAGFGQPYPQPPSGELSRFEPVAHHFNGATGSMTGWQIALIALGAAIVGAIIAMLVDRARAAHRRRPATAA
jgi:hypothetical protein